MDDIADDRFLLCFDNLKDPDVFEYQFKLDGEMLESGRCGHPRTVEQRFNAFKAARRWMHP